MKKLRLFTILSAFALAAAGAAGLASLKESRKTEAVEANSNIGSYTYYFTDNYSFDWNGSSHSKAIYAYAYNSANDQNAAWPGIQVGYSFNEKDERVYVYSASKSYSNIIWHNNDNARAEVNSSSARAWFVTGWTGQYDGSEQKTNTDTWSPSNQTYYLYDYKNLFGGNAKCYAWQSNGSLQNADYPGVAMTKVQYGSGQLYSISLDCAFDEVKFGVGDSANTGDQWANKNRGDAFCWWDTGDGGWSDDLDWVKAHDWIYQTMHMRDILQSNTSDTGACRGANGYYQKAKTAYQNYSASIKTKMSEDELWNAVKTRFSNWATANGETATFSGTTLTVSARNSILFNTSTTTNVALIVVLSLVAISGIGGFIFVYRKRKSI